MRDGTPCTPDSNRFERALRAMALLGAALALLLFAGCGGGDSQDDASGGTTNAEPEKVSLQLNWFADANQVGISVAQALGFYEEKGIELEVIAGGPNNDGIANVASGKADIGAAADSGSFILAVSEGIPVKAFGVSVQEHPYALFSMPDTPLDDPSDLAGLKVGAPATAENLLKGFLAANDMSEDDLAGFTPVSFEPTPLLQGKIDAWGAWVIDVPQLSQLPEGYHTLQFSDHGLRQYADIYYARPEYIEEHPEAIEAFLRATARGWQVAAEDPDRAVRLAVSEYPDSDPRQVRSILDVALPLILNEDAKEHGWGTMDPQVWEDQIELWDRTGQLENDAPALDDVITTELIEATEDDRKQG